jgi:ABC-type molybdate transport system substrate-binding protein
VSFVLVSDVVSALRRTTRRHRLPATNDNSRTALTATLAPNVWIDATNSIKAYLPSTMKLYGRRPFGLDQIALVVRTGNPTHVAGLSAFAAGSGSKTGWCTVTTACGVLARDAVAAAHVHAAPSTTARSSYALIGALEEGRLDAVLAMSSDAATANTATTTVPISPPPARFLTYDTVLLDQSSLAAQYAAWIATSPLAAQILAAHGFVRRPPKAP